MADSAFTTPTAAALKSLIVRTPLTDKLLSKPPFRYLHDIVSELLASSPAAGFGAGLFVGDETNAAAVKDKDQKIAWLAKIIKLTELASGTTIKAKPAKIIAGLEPEETNVWLQVLAATCVKGIDTRAMVTSLGGTPPAAAPAQQLTAPPVSEQLVSAPTAPPTPSQLSDVAQPTPATSANAVPTETKPSAKPADPPASAKSPASKPTLSSTKDKDKDKKTTPSGRSAPSAGASRSSSSSKKPDAPAKSSSSSSSTARKPSTSSKEKSSSRDKLASSKPSKSQSNSVETLAAKPKPAASDAVAAAPTPDAPAAAAPTDDAAPPPVMVLAAAAPAPAPAPSPEAHIDDDASEAAGGAADTTSLGDLVARPVPGTARRERPTTARKAPPRAKPVAPEMGAEPIGAAATAASGGLAARPGTASVVNVMTDASAAPAAPAAGLGLGAAPTAATDDADDMFIVQRDQADDLPVFGGLATALTQGPPPGVADSVDTNAPHGGLVRKLLESKRVAADTAPGARPASGMRRATSGGDQGPAADAGGKDLAQDLQARVQAVTRAAHPLGRTLDYLHEDMEAMNKELAQWKAEAAKFRGVLIKEREATELKVRPLLDEMAKLDAAIVLEQERIAQAKARVLANEQLVEKYVMSMVTPGV